ncbi:MAG: hypothetical protein ACI4XM_06635, partial [Candidatus Coprovivens sp.]
KVEDAQTKVVSPVGNKENTGVSQVKPKSDDSQLVNKEVEKENQNKAVNKTVQVTNLDTKNTLEKNNVQSNNSKPVVKVETTKEQSNTSQAVPLSNTNVSKSEEKKVEISVTKDDNK